MTCKLETMDTETLELDAPIPNSWVDEAGIRHAVVWEAGLDEYMRLEKVDGQWILTDNPPF